ncbi:Cytochrome P450 4C1, partial [Ooceraea biroi]
IIAERKRYHESTGGRYLNFENEAEDNDMIGSRKKRLAMLDLMIAASNNNQMSDSDIREEVDTFMFEGHDTVSMALTFTILLLAEHKDVQVFFIMKYRIKINTINLIQLKKSAPVKLAEIEICCSLESYLVPAGANVIIDIVHLHQNPDFWPNPEVFDPDRFLPELVQNRHPFAYLPFSAGSRNCIGQRFAMMEMKTVIGTLVHNFNLEPIDHLKDVRCSADIIIRIGQPIRVKFVPI